MPEISIQRPSSVVQPDREWFGTQDINKIGLYYRLALVQVDGLISVYNSDQYYVGPGNSQTVPVEYTFTVPPKVHELTEPFATHITPTQNAGRYVESHGSILKEVRLSGTTGLRPHPNRKQRETTYKESLSGVITTANTPREAEKSNTLESEETGHDLISRLKNLFRIYSDVCERGTTDIVMAWYNIKDGEYWVVEPTQISFTQDSKSPLTTNYSLVLKTIIPLQAVAKGTVGDKPKPTTTVLQEATRDITKYALIISTAPQAITKAALSKIDPVSGVAMAAAQAPSAVFGGFLTAVKDLENGTIGATERVLLQSFNLANMAITARTEMTKSALVGSHVDRVKNAWKRIQIASERVIASSINQDTGGRYRRVRDRIIKAYKSGGTSPTTSGDSTFLPNVPTSNTVSQDVVHQGDNIRSIAQRLLGDPKNWKDLVLMNELVPPYISPVPTTKVGVLSPGQKILYPAKNGVQRLQQNNQPTQKDYDNEDTTQDYLLNLAYGTDIRLTSIIDSESLVEFTDYAVNDRGDLGVITGVPNMHQAMRIKFAVEQGELKAHPRFGAKYAIGRKASIRSFDEFKINSLATLLSDPRIELVRDITLTTEGDKLYFFARVKLTGAQDFTNVSFDMRR